MRDDIPARERWGRRVGLGLFVGMIVWRMVHIPDLSASWIVWTRWSLVTSLFALFLLAYVRRTRARALAEGWRETGFALLCAGFPFAVELGPHLLDTWLTWSSLLEPQVFIASNENLGWSDARPGLILMALGEAIAVAGMLTLGSSFSIFTEVRELRRDGLYKYIRHPLYTGEILALWGMALSFPCWWRIVGAALFTLFQLSRAKVEERKLERYFPDYAQYRRETGFVLPKLFPLNK